MEKDRRPPGLRGSADKPIWRATKRAVAEGFTPKTVNLTRLAGDAEGLAAACSRMQSEMTRWLRDKRSSIQPARFDGTIGSLLDCYCSDPESRYQTIKHSTRVSYDVYIRLMTAQIGKRRVNDCDGRDVQRWFAAWKAPAERGGEEMLAKGRMAIAVLKAALTFGVLCRFPGCAEFRVSLDAVRLQSLAPRTAVITAAQIVAARDAARALGHAPAALAYALQFDGMLRQWDVVGQWVPISEKVASALIWKGSKWIGPTWRNVDADMILRIKPSKTALTSSAEVAIDLTLCPMVMEELGGVVPPSGPLIVDPATGRPYKADKFNEIWRAVAAAAGIPDDVWSRDIRASGVTDARASGATLDDVRKVVGHTPASPTTGRVYDRATLEAQRRIATARNNPKT